MMNRVACSFGIYKLVFYLFCVVNLVRAALISSGSNFDGEIRLDFI